MPPQNRQPETRTTDATVIELLRVHASLGIGDLAAALGVTATAVRQRVERLMRAGLIERTTVPRPRGRPSHAYSLTTAGQRSGGDNFRDLAFVLWREIRAVREASVRQGLLSRIGSAMADIYRDRVQGDTPGDRLRSVAEIMRERSISCEVEGHPEPGRATGDLSVLTSYSCPFPDLAEQDRAICAAERFMLQDLVGSSVALSECRLDGASCCRFTASGAAGAEAAAGT